MSAHAKSEKIEAIGEHIVHVLVNPLFSLLCKEEGGPNFEGIRNPHHHHHLCHDISIYFDK